MRFFDRPDAGRLAEFTLELYPKRQNVTAEPKFAELIKRLKLRKFENSARRFTLSCNCSPLWTVLLLMAVASLFVF